MTCNSLKEVSAKAVKRMPERLAKPREGSGLPGDRGYSSGPEGELLGGKIRDDAESRKADDAKFVTLWKWAGTALPGKGSGEAEEQPSPFHSREPVPLPTSPLS